MMGMNVNGRLDGMGWFTYYLCGMYVCIVLSWGVIKGFYSIYGGKGNVVGGHIALALRFSYYGGIDGSGRLGGFGGKMVGLSVMTSIMRID